jgi:hypothetical protein
MRETIMKDQELFGVQISTQPSYEAEAIEQIEPRPSSENFSTEARLRTIHSICLADCSIPE